MPSQLDNVQEIKLGTDVYTFNPADLIITGRDDPDLKQAAAKFAWWLIVAARARRKVSLADRDYRRWRAREANSLLAKDPKLSEGKRDNLVTDTDDFSLYKRRIADFQKAADIADAAAQGYDKKMDMLRTLRADRRAELDASTDLDPVFSKDGGKRQDNDAKVRAAMKRGVKDSAQEDDGDE